MTNQEIFDTVAKHLLTQGRRSQDKDRNNCLYRGPGNLKCAVGILISDADYKPSMENRGPDVLKGKFGLFANEDIMFLCELQTIHDCDDPSDWKDKLLELAQQYNLDASTIV